MNRKEKYEKNKWEEIAKDSIRKIEQAHGKLPPSPRFLRYLEDKNFFELLNKELNKMIVEEEDTRKTILLIALGGMAVVNAQSTSLNLMVHDDSGAGKDYIVKSVLKLLPYKKIVTRKRISPTAFCYWNNVKTAPTWSWDSKVFYNEDISNTMLNSDVFKVFSSAEIGGISTSTIVVQNKAIDISIRGKPVMVLTIASAAPNAELLRRFPICNLDTSEEQTKLILRRKAEYHEKGILPEYSKVIKEALWWIRPAVVKVPYAGLLVNVLNTSHVIIRTHYDRFIDYIKFSCAIHQYQRDMDDEGNFIATEQDYEIARMAMLKTTSNIFSIPITKNQDRILKIMQGLSKGREPWFSAGDLLPHITFISEKTLYTQLDKLTNLGFLAKQSEERAISKKPVMVYKPIKHINIDIPTWENLKKFTNTTYTTITTTTTNVTIDRSIEANESIEAHMPETITVEEEELEE